MPLIGEVQAGSVADVAGLEAGQEIVAVDGAETPTWQALSFRLLDRIGDTGTINFSVKYPDSDVVYESEAYCSAGCQSRSSRICSAAWASPCIRRKCRRWSRRWCRAVPPSGRPAAWRPGTARRWRAHAPVDGLGGVRAGASAAADRTGVAARWRVVAGRDSARARSPMSRGDFRPGRRGGGLPEMPPEMVRQFQRGPLEALGASFTRTGELMGLP